jgi:hypothetical protein
MIDPDQKISAKLRFQNIPSSHELQSRSSLEGKKIRRETFFFIDVQISRFHVEIVAIKGFHVFQVFDPNGEMLNSHFLRIQMD